jgi:membrane protease subunit (stomatin/prohibitin family)
MFRRRPLARAAVVGGVAYTAGKAGARSAANDADQSAPAEQPPAEQQAAPEASAETAAPSADQSMEELTKLKGLLDSGALTQAEFDAQKQNILQTM